MHIIDFHAIFDTKTLNLRFYPFLYLSNNLIYITTTKFFAIFRIFYSTVLIRPHFAKENLNLERELLNATVLTRRIISSY